jgi:hypothetical protein
LILEAALRNGFAGVGRLELAVDEGQAFVDSDGSIHGIFLSLKCPGLRPCARFEEKSNFATPNARSASRQNPGWLFPVFIAALRSKNNVQLRWGEFNGSFLKISHTNLQKQLRLF